MCESLRRSTQNPPRSLRFVWSSWSWKTSTRLATSSRLGADPAGSGRRNTFSVSMFWNVTQGNYVFTLFKGVLRGKWCAMFVCVCFFLQYPFSTASSKMESQCRIPDFREDWSSVASLGGALYCLFGISLNRFDCTFQNLTPKRLFGNFKNVNTRRYCKFQTSVFVRINLLHLLASFCKVRQTPWFSQNVKICEFQV